MVRVISDARTSDACFSKASLRYSTAFLSAYVFYCAIDGLCHLSTLSIALFDGISDEYLAKLPSSNWHILISFHEVALALVTAAERLRRRHRRALSYHLRDAIYKLRTGLVQLHPSCAAFQQKAGRAAASRCVAITAVYSMVHTLLSALLTCASRV